MEDQITSLVYLSEGACSLKCALEMFDEMPTRKHEKTFGREDKEGLQAMQATKIYRSLLRAVKKHIGKGETTKHFRDYVMQEFQKNKDLSDSSSIQQKLKLASDYTFLLNSVHQQKDLLLSYNIAVDRSDEVKRTLGKSAASVGLQLPEAYHP